MDTKGNTQPQGLSEARMAFNGRLDAFIDSCMKDQKRMDRYSEQRHTCSSHDEVDIIGLAMDEARHQFIIQNLEEHKQSLNVPSGMYFLKYKDLVGQIFVIKIIKQ